MGSDSIENNKLCYAFVCSPTYRNIQLPLPTSYQLSETGWAVNRNSSADACNLGKFGHRSPAQLSSVFLFRSRNPWDKPDKCNHRRKVQDVRRMLGTLGSAGRARRVWAVVAGPINSGVWVFSGSHPNLLWTRPPASSLGIWGKSADWLHRSSVSAVPNFAGKPCRSALVLKYRGPCRRYFSFPPIYLRIKKKRPHNYFYVITFMNFWLQETILLAREIKILYIVFSSEIVGSLPLWIPSNQNSI